MRPEERLSRALGWFSIGLGLTELLAPRDLAKVIGVRAAPENQTLLRLLGLREIASGIAILTQTRPLAPMLSRVGGDAMDLALLGAALNDEESDRARVMAATAAVVGVTVLDALCSQQLTHTGNGHAVNSRGANGTNGTNGKQAAKQLRSKGKGNKGMDVKQTLTIGRSPEELYTFWRNFPNLAQFMTHLVSVQDLGNGRSHWTAKAPAGTTVEWDAEIVDDQPDRRIAWRSLEGAGVQNSGSVQFESATGGRGTVVRLQMQYSPPGGKIGAGIAKLMGEEPEQQTWEDMHRFKQLMETGEIVLSEGAPEGMGSVSHPAQQLAASDS